MLGVKVSETERSVKGKEEGERVAALGFWFCSFCFGSLGVIGALLKGGLVACILASHGNGLRDFHGIFAENLVLGQLTRQWKDCSLDVLRERHRLVRESWADLGAFHIWFNGWFLLDGPRKLKILESTLKFDRVFAISMLQAVYLYQRSPLDALD
ncbi:unnamed protein product [Symbiodinium sp. CCMP2592]|nr:unnamed protein product [Symbiodinium sp. CCMP2592]